MEKLIVSAEVEETVTKYGTGSSSGFMRKAILTDIDGKKHEHRVTARRKKDLAGNVEDFQKEIAKKRHFVCEESYGKFFIYKISLWG